MGDAVPSDAKRTAGAVLTARIADLVGRLRELEPAVRADAPDAVHQMRITARRLRGALGAYRRLLADDLGAVEELRWLGSSLGRARDAEVLGARLLGLARELPYDAGRDGVVSDLEQWSALQAREGRVEVLAALDSDRYRALLALLGRLAGEPPLTARAGERADREIERTIRRERRRTERRVTAALEAVASVAEGVDSGSERDRALHDARKAAKRARYAGELGGTRQAGFTRRMKAVQDVLGRHQDAVIACTTVRRLSDGGFGYGVLYGREVAAAERAREELPGVWGRGEGA
ncbi:CHAD domain-containing protein [Kitasatospora camelliae]|uniref:CHAD domain-containing protein n=1 Tax=Kitasatospora camelliae TaxID=3156397 RepID=A0AAU8K378_9ACTN